MCKKPHIEMGSDRIIENANHLAKYEEISWVAAAIGGSSLSIQTCSPDIDGLYQFVTEEIHLLPELKRTSTSIVTCTLKDIHEWRIPESVLDRT